jgi:6,7-dimethyl-8-ribityllumazine synthase
VPVLSVVPTRQQFHEHADHHAFFADHLFTKGMEAARALEAMVGPERVRGGAATPGCT